MPTRQKIQPNTQIILYSRDRAMQLDATLNSLLFHCIDFEYISEVRILFKATNITHQYQYATLAEKYSGLSCIKFQNETDFRKDTVQFLEANLNPTTLSTITEILRPTKFTLFLVDDSIFIREFSVVQMTNILKSNLNIINFSLRLGRNIKYSYILDRPLKQPIFDEYSEEIDVFKWKGEDFDFGYPMDISSTLYRTIDIIFLLFRSRFRNPNSLEGRMNIRAKKILRFLPNKMACYMNSVCFCAPMNRVQNEVCNKSSSKQAYLPENLSELFNEGYRINITGISGFTPDSCHQEVEFEFCKNDIINLRS